MTDSPAAPTTAQTAAPAKRRWPRRLLFAGIATLLVLFLLVALLPTLLSTGPGRNLVLGVVNGSIEGKVEAQSLKLSWLGGQRASGVNVTGPRGTAVVRNLSLDAPGVGLLAVARGSRDFGDIAINADAVRLVANEAGQLDLPAAKAGTQGNQAAASDGRGGSGGGAGGVDTKVTLTVGMITFERTGEPTQTLSQFDANAEVRGNRKIDLQMTAGVVGEADREPGQLDATVKIDNLTDAAGKVQAEQATVDADIKLIGIPTPLLAALSGQAALNDYVGPTLTTTLTAKGTLANFTADAVLPNLTLPAGEGKSLRFSEGTLNVKPGANPSELALTLRGRATTGEVSEAVTLDAALAHLFDDTPLGIRATTTKLPVPLVDALAAQDGKLTATLGDLLDLQVTLAEHAEGGYALSGRIDAPNLAGPFEGRYDAENLLAFSTPSPLRLTLSPRAYDLWTADAETGAPANLRLAETLTANLSVPSIRLVVLPTEAGEDAGVLGMRIDPARSTATLNVTSDKAVIERLDPAATVTLASLQLDVQSENLNAIELIAQLEAIIDQAEQQLREPNAPANNAAAAPAAPANGTPGKITSRTTIKNLFNARGIVAFEGSTIDSKSDLQAVPAALVDLLANQNGSLAATTGRLINGDLNVQYQSGQAGRATVKLDATNLKGTIPVQIAPDFSAATLTDDIRVTLWVTEEISQSYLGSSHPLFADAVSSDPDKPVNVTIKKEDVVIPLDGSFDIKQLTMQGTIDPGTLNMKRSGWINQAVTAAMAQVFKREPRARGEVRTYPARFSPMNFTLKDGLLDTSELWLASDDMGLGFQGKLNLNSGQIDKMAVGILAGSFYALGGSDVRRLDPGTVLEVPLSGPISLPKPDVAGLFAANLDTILDVAAGATDEKTAAWINLGKTLLEGGRAKQGGGGKYTYAWHPSEAAALFTEQLRPKPEESPAATDEAADANPSGEPPAAEPDPAPAEASPSREPTLQDLLEQLRERQRQREQPQQ